LARVAFNRLGWPYGPNRPRVANTETSQSTSHIRIQHRLFGSDANLPVIKILISTEEGKPMLMLSHAR
jgi:hypothetical protein